MKTSKLSLLLVATAAALGGCNAPDTNRTTNAPAGIEQPTAVVEPLTSPSAPPAAAERGPIPANSNAAAPGTDASVALATDGVKPGGSALGPVSSPATDAPHVDAQSAAANAPDTASADGAKAAAGTGAKSTGTAQDTPANNPRSGTLTKEEESTQMPKAGQANNHSSTALEADSGKTPKL